MRLDVLHLPGHTPGLVCLGRRGDRLLFADDHLLARTSPNPFLELVDGAPPGARSSSIYIPSRGSARSTSNGSCPATVFRSRGTAAAIDSLLRFYVRRQEKLLETLGSGPRTPVELSYALFGPQEGARLYLTLSEVVGNLEVLEDAHRVRRLVDGPIDRWALTG